MYLATGETLFAVGTQLKNRESKKNGYSGSLEKKICSRSRSLFILERVWRVMDCLQFCLTDDLNLDYTVSKRSRGAYERISREGERG
jgi:hypothetical protein